MNDSPLLADAPEPSRPAPPPAPPAPSEYDLNALQRAPLPELTALAASLGVRTHSGRSRHTLVNDSIRAALARPGVRVKAEGVVEVAPELGGGGVLRWPGQSFAPCPEDVFVPQGMMKTHGLRPGQLVAGLVRLPAGGQREKLLVLDRIVSVEGIPAGEWRAPAKGFDQLTPMFPNQRIILESPKFSSTTVRAIDLLATLGRGQRGLIVAPPRAGKTVMLKQIAQAIRAGSPDMDLIVLLVDERPEEVTDFCRELDAAVYSSTFDEGTARHIQVAELVSERAKRLVELGRHVVILLDSITRLSRGYNGQVSAKAARTMTGGVDSKALAKPKRFFSAARNTEEGGSLTILATALIETGSRMDDVIFEEYKGTGNMELHLDRELLERRVFPAIHILKSGTRRDELLYHPDEFARVQVLRKQLAELPPMEAMEGLIANLGVTKSNLELLLAGLKF